MDVPTGATDAGSDPGSDAGSDPWRPVTVGVAAVAAVMVAGTIAYTLLGLGPFDAFYQTLITVTTVGYTEVGDRSDTTYRMVTSAVIVVGVGVSLYTIGAAFEAVMEGALTDRLGRVRMERVLADVSDHVVICGCGQVGRSIARAVVADGSAVVVVDRDQAVVDRLGWPGVAGDATDDDVLRHAGVPRARALVVALDSDADNMYVTLSGRQLNPGLFIVTRANRAQAEAKLHQAGADRVVNPHQIGGDRMASFVTQPNVADFLGESMHDRRLEIRLREVEVTVSSGLAGQSLSDCDIVGATGVTVLAVRGADGTFDHRPRPDEPLDEGDVLITLGTPEQHYALRAWLNDGSEPGDGG